MICPTYRLFFVKEGNILNGHNVSITQKQGHAMIASIAFSYVSTKLTRAKIIDKNIRNVLNVIVRSIYAET
jgi:hypothetical protein